MSKDRDKICFDFFLEASTTMALMNSIVDAIDDLNSYMKSNYTSQRTTTTTCTNKKKGCDCLKKNNISILKSKRSPMHMYCSNYQNLLNCVYLH